MSLVCACPQGLDRVVAAANAHGMRLVLTLTNYLSAYGGAQQWVQWFNGTSIIDFWTDPSIRRARSGIEHDYMRNAMLPERQRLRFFSACCMAGAPTRTM